MTLFQTQLESPLGPIEIWASERGLCALLFDEHRSAVTSRIQRRFSGCSIQVGDPFGAGPALFSWLNGDLHALASCPLDPGGTPFQCSVWTALREIPPGQTRSYGQIAHTIGRPTAARAVGAANGANPVPLFVPCHRVIGSNGALSGFAFGVQRKRWLLDFEALHA